MFKKKDVYVNQEKKKPNYIVVMILSIIIATAWTSNFYEYRLLKEDYNHAIVIYNTAHNNRIERSGDAVKATTQATTDGEEITVLGTPLAVSIEDQIKKVAQEQGFEDAQLLVDIAFCESSLNPTATNNNSSATGLFQILDMHNLTVEERCDVETSTKWAINKINNGGLNAWNSSKHCWG